MVESPATVVIVGLTGAGKSLAIQQLESLGFVGIEALPPGSLPQVVAEAQDLHPHLALGVDLRCAAWVDQFEGLRSWLQLPSSSVIFLEARESILIQRVSAHRRRHFYTEEGGGVLEAIRRERQVLEPVRQRAAHVLDTSDLSGAQLRQQLQNWLGTPISPLQLSLVSFGFKFGVPLDANLMFDVRFLPNPFFDPQLRPLTGQDPRLQEFLFAQAQTRSTHQQILELLQTWLPRYQQERRAHLTLAVGCTGGQHRSVAMVERLAQSLSDRLLPGVQLQISHRHLHLSQQEIQQRFPTSVSIGAERVPERSTAGVQPHA